MKKQPVRGNLADFIRVHKGSQFVVPVYQRNYSWNPEKETARLMDDIEILLKKKNTSHFLGIIIYIETEVSGGFKQLQIIDGQQRLTTLFLFLLALRNTAASADKKTASGIENNYLFNNNAGEKEKMRLKPSSSSDHIYYKLLYGSEIDVLPKEKDTTLYRNYRYICDRIRQWCEKYKCSDILHALSRVDVLSFPLSQDDDTQQIYESINATGGPLSSTDLIRNCVLMNHTDDVQERFYAMYWKPLEDSFPSVKKMEDFFRYFLAAKTYNLLSRRDIYDGFKLYWQRWMNSDERKLQEINRYMRYFNLIYLDSSEDKTVDSALKDFRLSSSYVPAPFMMEMARLYTENKISMKSFVNVIRLIDSYLMRRSLCGMDNNPLGRYFPILLRSVMRSFDKDKEDIYEITKVNLVGYNRGKTNAMPTDEQLRLRLKEIDAYSIMNLRAVLERIEHDGSNAKVDTSSLNIEHIMPQSPNAYWKKVSLAKNEDDYAFIVNLIGNLTLCNEEDNAQMGNEDFAYKKRILAKTGHIRINQDILKQKVWNKNSILHRCDTLTKQIIKLYPYAETEARLKKTDADILVLSSPTTNARAIFHNAGRIEVLPGTIMKAYGTREMKKMRDLYADFISRDIIHENADGRARFDRSADFENLNEAARFLMHRGGENTNAWMYEDGRRYGEPVKEERKPAGQKKKKTSVHREKGKAAKSTRQQIRRTRNPRGIAPQKKDARSVRQPVHMTRFAGQNGS